MSGTKGSALSRREIDGVEIRLIEEGSGDPILFLHGAEGIDPQAAWFRSLAEGHRVIAPWHPGFGLSERPEEFRTVADLAFFYLELIAELDLRDATLIGADFGGWLAAEIAIRSLDGFSRLVLVDPLGIKVSGKMERDITDLHALDRDQLARTLYHDPALAEVDYAALDDDELLGIARTREAFTFFGWKPYMNNPGLRRWLRRIRVPALVVWGESDGVVGLDYARHFAAELPDARLEVIPEAGHYPHLEQPDRFVELVEGFVAATPATDND